MASQHTTSNSNSNSQKPALEARKADGTGKAVPAPRFRVGDVVRVVNAYGVPLGLKTITEVEPVTRPWESWMERRYYLSPTDTPWYAFAESSLTLHVPALPHGCGSWVVTSPAGRTVELYERTNVEAAAVAGWKVETAIDYLARINAQIRAGEA